MVSASVTEASLCSQTCSGRNIIALNLIYGFLNNVSLLKVHSFLRVVMDEKIGKTPNRSRTPAGKELAKIRIDQDETLNRMAQRLGVHPVHLSKVTTGTSPFTIGMAERVREVYGADLTQYVDRGKRRIIFELELLSESDQATILSIYAKMTKDRTAEEAVDLPSNNESLNDAASEPDGDCI